MCQREEIPGKERNTLRKNKYNTVVVLVLFKHTVVLYLSFLSVFLSWEFSKDRNMLEKTT